MLPKIANDIRKSDLEKWIAAISKKLAPKTIKVIIQSWRQACEFCIERGLLDKNPFLKAKHPHIVASKINPFTRDDVETLLSTADGWLENYLAFAFYTGARSCEILALRWDDIDMQKKTICISKSLVNGFVKQQTKTGVDRTIPLFDGLLPYIQKMSETKECEWVFSFGGDHLYGSADVMCAKKWKNLLEKCGIAYRSPRHTRHTFATIMVKHAAKGEFPMRYVSQILGHSNLDMTIKVYARFIEDEHLKIDRGLRVF